MKAFRSDLSRDVLAIIVGTCGAFVFRAAVRSYDSLSPDHIASITLPALPFCIAVALFSLWRSGLYGDQAGDATLMEICTALAWAAALLAFVAVFWSWGPEAPFLTIGAGYVLTMVLMVGARRLSRKRYRTTPA